MREVSPVTLQFLYSSFRYFLGFEKLLLPASPLFAGYESSDEEVPDLARMPIGRVSADRVIKFAESHGHSRMVSSESLRCATYAVLVDGKSDAIRASRAKWSESRDDLDNWERNRLLGGRDSEQAASGNGQRVRTTQLSQNVKGGQPDCYLTPANSLKRRVRREVHRERGEIGQFRHQFGWTVELLSDAGKLEPQRTQRCTEEPLSISASVC